MDDLLIISQTIIKLQKQTEKILQVCQNYKLSIKIEKYVFYKQEVKYLRLIIKLNYIAIGSIKLKRILKQLSPKKLKDIYWFLESIGFYRKFIQEYS